MINATVYAVENIYEVTKPTFTGKVYNQFSFWEGLAYVEGYYDDSQKFHDINGFINIFGEYVIVIPEEYNDYVCTNFVNGYSYIIPRYELKDAVAKIDKNGVITKLSTNSVKEEYITSDFTAKVINNKYKLFHKGKEVELPFESGFNTLDVDAIMYYKHYEFDNKYGLVTNTGKVLPCEYSNIDRIDKDIYKLKDKNGKISYVDNNLNPIESFGDKDISKFKDGLSYYNSNGKSIIVDKTGVTEFILDYYVSEILSKDCFIATNYGKQSASHGVKSGLIDSQSNIKVPFLYNQIYDTTTRFYLASDMEDVYLLSNSTFEIVDVFEQNNIYRYFPRDNFFYTIDYTSENCTVDIINFDGSVIQTNYNSIYPGDNVLYTEIYDLSAKYAPSRFGFYVIDNSPSVWAQSTVEEAISNKLIPNRIQNLYKEDITRKDFCELIIKYIETYLNKDYDNIIETYDIDTSSNKFIDTNDKYVILCNKLGIVNGKSSNIFAPFDLLTREEASVMLASMLLRISPNYLPLYNESTFDDKHSISSWAKYAVNIISSNSIIRGKANNKFAPKDNLTREEAFIIINRIFSQN